VSDRFTYQDILEAFFAMRRPRFVPKKTHSPSVPNEGVSSAEGGTKVEDDSNTEDNKPVQTGAKEPSSPETPDNSVQPVVQTPVQPSVQFSAPKYNDYIADSASRYGINPELLTRLIQVESNFDPNALSPAGAMGLTQVVPKWHPTADLSTPQSQIDYGAKYLKELYGQTGDWRLALAAYNGGIGRLRERDMDIGRMPQETQDYVKKFEPYNYEKGGYLPKFKAGEGKLLFPPPAKIPDSILDTKGEVVNKLKQRLAMRSGRTDPPETYNDKFQETTDKVESLFKTVPRLMANDQRIYEEGLASGHNDISDAKRHAMKAMFDTHYNPTSSSRILNESGISQIKDIVLAAPSAIYTNLLGFGHELGRWDWKESPGDLYNNFVGSMVGAIPFAGEDTKVDYVNRLAENGFLHVPKPQPPNFRKGGMLPKFKAGNGLLDTTPKVADTNSTYTPNLKLDTINRSLAPKLSPQQLQLNALGVNPNLPPQSNASVGPPQQKTWAQQGINTLNKLVGTNNPVGDLITGLPKFGMQVVRDSEKMISNPSVENTVNMGVNVLSLYDPTKKIGAALKPEIAAVVTPYVQKGVKAFHNYHNAHMYVPSLFDKAEGGYLPKFQYKKGGWIQKAINPAHKGYCTPMTKSTCTPHRKALARRFKSGDLHKKKKT